MNTNPSAKTIVCFGDSNTWGAIPASCDRYTADKRWTGILQNELGREYAIIEEGLSGRTTIYEHPSEPWKNGNGYLLPCLLTHDPIDLLILMLGTNDVKTTYHVPDDEIGKGIEELIRIVHGPGFIGNAKILIVAPPIIKDLATHTDPQMIHAPKKSALFASAYQKVAEKYHCHFLDAAKVIESSEKDGYHLDQNAHEMLGKAIAEEVLRIQA